MIFEDSMDFPFKNNYLVAPNFVGEENDIHIYLLAEQNNSNCVWIDMFLATKNEIKTLSNSVRASHKQQLKLEVLHETIGICDDSFD